MRGSDRGPPRGMGLQARPTWELRDRSRDPLAIPSPLRSAASVSPRVHRAHWGCGAAGSAPRSQRGGQGFESPSAPHASNAPRQARSAWRAAFERVDQADPAVLLPARRRRPRRQKRRVGAPEAQLQARHARFPPPVSRHKPSHALGSHLPSSRSVWTTDRQIGCSRTVPVRHGRPACQPEQAAHRSSTRRTGSPAGRLTPANSRLARNPTPLPSENSDDTSLDAAARAGPPRSGPRPRGRPGGPRGVAGAGRGRWRRGGGEAQAEAEVAPLQGPPQAHLLAGPDLPAPQAQAGRTAGPSAPTRARRHRPARTTGPGRRQPGWRPRSPCTWPTGSPTA